MLARIGARWRMGGCLMALSLYYSMTAATQEDAQCPVGNLAAFAVARPRLPGPCTISCGPGLNAHPMPLRRLIIAAAVRDRPEHAALTIQITARVAVAS